MRKLIEEAFAQGPQLHLPLGHVYRQQAPQFILHTTAQNPINNKLATSHFSLNTKSS